MYYYCERLELHCVGQEKLWRNGGWTIAQCEPEYWFKCGLFKSRTPLPDRYDISVRVRYVRVPQERIDGPMWDLIEPTARLLQLPD